MSNSTKSIMAKAARRQSRIPESARLQPPGSVEERCGPGPRHAASKDSLAGTATRSPGAWLRVCKKGSRDPGRREESLDGRSRSRRSRSFEVTGRRVGAGTVGLCPRRGGTVLTREAVELHRRRCRALGRRAGWEGHPQLPLASLCPPLGHQHPTACVPSPPPRQHGSSPKRRARGPSLWQPVAPRGLLLLSKTPQSRSEHAMPAGVQAASIQGLPKALPGAKPLYGQLPGEPPAGDGVQQPSPPPHAPAQRPGLLLKRPSPGAGVPSLPLPLQLPASPGKGQRPRLGCVTGNGARASSKDGGSHRYRAERLAGGGPDPVPSQRAERPSCQPQHHVAYPVPRAARGTPSPCNPLVPTLLWARLAERGREQGGGPALPVPNPTRARNPSPQGRMQPSWAVTPTRASRLLREGPLWVLSTQQMQPATQHHRVPMRPPGRGASGRAFLLPRGYIKRRRAEPGSGVTAVHSPTRPCLSPGMGNPPKIPLHAPCSFSAFIRKGVGCARAGMGQLPAVSEDGAPQASSTGGGSRPTHPSLGMHPAHRQALGCCCRGTPASIQTQCRGLAARHRGTPVPQGWHHRRAGLSLSPPSCPLGFVSLGWGCTCGCGLHISPPARPTRGWGGPSVPHPQLPRGTQGQRWGRDVAGGRAGRGGRQKAAPGPPGMDTSVYL